MTVIYPKFFSTDNPWYDYCIKYFHYMFDIKKQQITNIKNM